MQAQCELGDEAERALGPDEKRGQVIAGRGFARAPPGLDDAPGWSLFA